MFALNESEREYRHGDHGPKYLEQGQGKNALDITAKSSDIVFTRSLC